MLSVPSLKQISLFFIFYARCEKEMSHDVVRSANYVISSKCKKYLNIAQLALNIRSVAALTLARDHEEAPP